MESLDPSQSLKRKNPPLDNPNINLRMDPIQILTKQEENRECLEFRSKSHNERVQKLLVGFE